MIMLCSPSNLGLNHAVLWVTLVLMIMLCSLGDIGIDDHDLFSEWPWSQSSCSFLGDLGLDHSCFVLWAVVMLWATLISVIRTFSAVLLLLNFHSFVCGQFTWMERKWHYIDGNGAAFADVDCCIVQGFQNNRGIPLEACFTPDSQFVFCGKLTVCPLW